MRPARLSRWEVGVFSAALLMGTGLTLGGFSGGLRWYLAGLVAWTAVPVGSLLLRTIGDVAGGRWRSALGPALRRGCGMMAPTALLYLPILVAPDVVYPWAAPGWGEPGSAKNLWLDPAFFALRGGGYLVLWSALALLSGCRPPMAIGGLVALSLTVPLAGVDWVMSLDPEFNSSIFGLLFMAGLAAGGLAFAVLATLAAGPPPQAVRQLGGLLLASVLVWGYLAFMQYLVVWSGNLPAEAVWYLRRGEGAWAGLALVLVLFHGLLPIAALLSGAARGSPSVLAGVAALLLLGRLAEAAWLVLPRAG